MNPLEILQLARADLACYAVAQWPGFELAAHHRLLVKLEDAGFGDLENLADLLEGQPFIIVE